MRIRLYLVSLVVLSFCGLTSAQNTTLHRNAVVKADTRLDTLIAIQQTIYTEANYFSGYRVQIYSDSGNSSKSKAMDIQSTFARTNPEVNTYLTFSEPYYKVRVGDFRTRIEAEKLLQSIVSTYPAAFIVADKIVFCPNKQ